MTECQVTECMRPECIHKCGPISWFGNMSDCDVTLQYKLGEEGLWRSLGQYGPGMHTELGGGALWLPQEARVRAVESSPSLFTDPSTGRVIQDWGRLGSGLPSLYVDNTMCVRDSTTATAPAPPVPCTTVKQCPPRWLWVSTCILAALGAAGVLVILLLKKQHVQRK